MASQINHRTLDLLFVGIVNLLNLTLVGMFVARVHGPQLLASVLGSVSILLALPIAGIVILNAMEGREWWTIVLPCFMVFFMVLTAVLDYVLHSDFRNTRFLWPYVVLFFWSLMLLVGYAFLVETKLGFVTLGTYYVCVAASLYEYFKLVHQAG
jgi:CDP-diglyceride synthetase